MAKSTPGEFVRQVRQEGAKVAWPSRKETSLTSVMVFVMVFIMSLFFLGVDGLLSYVIGVILGFGG